MNIGLGISTGLRRYRIGGGSTTTTTTTSSSSTTTSTSSTTTTSTSSTTTTTTTFGPQEGWELLISLCGTDYVQASPETYPVEGRYWNNTNKTPNEETGVFIANMVDIEGNTLTGVNFVSIVSTDVSASDGRQIGTLWPTNARRSSYPAPSSGAVMKYAIDGLPPGIYEVYLVSSSTTTQHRTNLTVKPNGGEATSEGTVVADTGSSSDLVYEFSNGGSGIVLGTSGSIHVEYSRNTSGGASHGRLNIIRLIKRTIP